MSLSHVEGRVIVRVNMESKNSHTFASGQTIRIERNYNNFNQREVRPVNAIVEDSEYIPKGSEILIHHNALIDSNKIFNYSNLSGSEIASDIKYYSISENQCFLWRHNEDWEPLKGFATALRVFKPYKGFLTGISPERIKGYLYITSGEFKGQVVHAEKNSDYQIVFQDIDGREGNVIRLRHYENECNDREEITAIHHEFTKKVNKGTLLVGLTANDAKSILQLENNSDCYI